MALSCECAEKLRVELCDNSIWGDDFEETMVIDGETLPQNWKERWGRLAEITNNGKYGKNEDGTDITLNEAFCRCWYIDDYSELEYPDGEGTDGVPKVQLKINKCLEPGDEYIVTHGDESLGIEEEKGVVPEDGWMICNCCCYKEMNHQHPLYAVRANGNTEEVEA
tara:strand:- start:2 stop:499 length:498 start_codon:yes stop_codon:yes gene_type:complete